MFRLTSIHFSSRLTDRCSHEFLTLSKQVIAEIYEIFRPYGHYGLSQLNVISFGSSGITKLSGQVQRAWENASDELMKGTIRNGSLGNLRVDTSLWNTTESNYTSPFPVCKNESCPMPPVTVSGVYKSFSNVIEIQRSRSRIFKGRLSVSACDSVNDSYSFKWSATALNKEGKTAGIEKILSSESTELNLEKNTLEYGLYSIKLSCTRHGVTVETADDYGLIRITPSPLVARIAGGYRIMKGFTQPVVFDASSSYDPDVGLYRRDGVVFTWACRVVGENWSLENISSLPFISVSHGNGTGCFGTGIGRIPSQQAQEKLLITSGLLKVGRSYEFLLMLDKGERKTKTTQIVQIIPGDPPNIELRCNANCGVVANPSSKLSLEVTCENDGCKVDTVYMWEMYKQTSPSNWLRIQHLDTLLMTKVSAPGFVLRSNTLRGGIKYRAKVNVSTPGRTKTSNEYIFTTNAPPYGGQCSISPQTGESLTTNFVLECTGWSDKEMPLEYHFRYRKTDGLFAVLSHGSDKKTTCQLPAGPKSKEHSVDIEVLVSDSYGATNSTSIRVKVLPKQAAPNSTLASTLSSFTVGQTSDIATMRKTGNIDGATQLANAVLDAIGSVSAGNQETITSSLIDHMVDIKVENVESLIQVSSVVASATMNDAVLTNDSKSLSLKMLNKMTQLLEVKSSDDNQQSGEIDKAGQNLFSGLSNILKAASKDAHFKSSDSPKTQQIHKLKTTSQSINLAQESVLIMKKLSITLLVSKTVGEEPTKIQTKHTSLVLARSKPFDVGGTQIKDGNSSFILPSAETLFGSRLNKLTVVDTQLVITSHNPYSWDSTSVHITSSVISLSCMDKSGSDIQISNLTSAIVISIPRVDKSTPNPPQEKTFLKPSNGKQMQYRKVNVDIPGSMVATRIGTSSNEISIIAYLKFGQRPTVNDYDFSTKVPDFSSCQGQPSNSCSRDPYVITIPGSVLKSKGVYIMGLLYQESSTTDQKPQKRRVRRSCDGTSGRQKRSCVEMKPAPTTPPPRNVTLVPVYNPSRDVNITFSSSISSCMYWSTSQQKWTSDGCKSSNQSSSSKLQCLCSHLTSFGGDFLVAPNPIDFDVVVMGFSNLDETKNFSVIGLTIALFLLYFIVLIFCRRADRRDRSKVGPKIEIDHGELDTTSYQVTIDTGLWYQSGTTANVAMVITGTENTSDVITIFHDDFPKRHLFGRGNNDQFVCHVLSSLGELLYVHIWHDNTGNNPSWFLGGVHIEDCTTFRSWDFPCNRWLDVIKEDGAIERILPSKAKVTEFNQSIKNKTTNSFVEEHLWISVMAKSPLSYFTRVQRATCCLSLLFSAMIVNAMFYNIGGKSDNIFQVGPLQFSLRQIVIGIESSLIVAPINIIIVQLFRVASKLRVKEEKNPNDNNMITTRRTSSQQELLGVRKRASRVPSTLVKCTAYLLAFICMVVSATFTIFYSMQWGTDLSNQWLTSMIVSFVQDLVVIQPVKIVIIAVILTLLAQKLSRKTKCQSLSNIRPAEGAARRYQVEKQDCKIQPLNDEKKKKHKERKMKDMKLRSIVKEIAFYLCFLILLCLVCYGARTKHGYLMNNALKQVFGSFDEVTDDESFYDWLNRTLIQNLYATTWYNKRVVTNKVYIDDKWSILVGMPRMKQVRTQQGDCIVAQEFRSQIPRCIAAYSMDREYKTKLNLPGWNKAVPGSTLFNQTLTPETCPKPWRYHTSKEITSLPYWGRRNVYGGGGYVAHLGYKPDIAARVVNELSTSKWLDRRSSAVLILFSVFNINTEYASFLSLLYERLPTGAGLAWYTIHSTPLYAGTTIFLTFQLLFLLCVLVYFVLLFIKVVKLKCSFFKDVWNWLDLFVVLLSVTTVIVQLMKGFYTSDVISQIHANPYNDLSFDYVVRATDLEDSLIALLVFVSTLKLLQLVKLHLSILVISSAMRISFRDLAPYSVIFIVILLAFAQAGIVVFGHEEEAFYTLYNALSTELQLFIGGGSELWLITEKNHIIGPLYILTFQLFMGFILLNVFIAILNDAQFQQKRNLASLHQELNFVNFMKKKLLSFFNKSKVEDLYDVLPETPEMTPAPSTETTQHAAKPVLNVVCHDQLPKATRTKKTARRKLKENTWVSPKTGSLVNNKSTIAGQEAILLFHERIQKISILLDILEMELTDEDMQMTEFVLKLESNCATRYTSSVSRQDQTVPTPEDTLSLLSPGIFQDKRRDSTVTLSNVALSTESEEQLQITFPRPANQTAAGNSRFRPLVLGRVGVHKAVKLLHGIKENRP